MPLSVPSIRSELGLREELFARVQETEPPVAFVGTERNSRGGCGDCEGRRYCFCLPVPSEACKYGKGRFGKRPTMLFLAKESAKVFTVST